MSGCRLPTVVASWDWRYLLPRTVGTFALDSVAARRLCSRTSRAERYGVRFPSDDRQEVLTLSVVLPTTLRRASTIEGCRYGNDHQISQKQSTAYAPRHSGFHVDGAKRFGAEPVDGARGKRSDGHGGSRWWDDLVAADVVHAHEFRGGSHASPTIVNVTVAGLDAFATNDINGTSTLTKNGPGTLTLGHTAFGVAYGAGGSYGNGGRGGANAGTPGASGGGPGGGGGGATSTGRNGRPGGGGGAGFVVISFYDATGRIVGAYLAGATGSRAVPFNATRVKVWAVGAGGSGGSVPGSSPGSFRAGGGGGAGGTAWAEVNLGALTAINYTLAGATTVTIGGVTLSADAGAAGGNSGGGAGSQGGGGGGGNTFGGSGGGTVGGVPASNSVGGVANDISGLDGSRAAGQHQHVHWWCVHQRGFNQDHQVRCDSRRQLDQLCERCVREPQPVES